MPTPTSNASDNCPKEPLALSDSEITSIMAAGTSGAHQLAEKPSGACRTVASCPDVPSRLGIDVAFSREGRAGSRVIRIRTTRKNTVHRLHRQQCARR
jgi:hypothetical protein